MALFKTRADKAEQELRNLVQNCEIPYFRQSALDVLNMLRDPEACFQKIAECLQWDSGLVLRVLQTVNSAAYGTATRIDDVQHAVSFLGRSQLEQLVLALVVKDAVPKAQAPGFDAKRYWHTAAFRAALGRAIANQLHPARNAEAFTSGLLQDIAIPVLAHSQPERYGAVLQEWHSQQHRGLEELESEVFGWCHAKVGGLLGEVWDLPDGLRMAIQSHHEREQSDWDVLPSVRLVALLRETHQDHGVEALVEEARVDYGLQRDWTVQAVEEAHKQAADLAQTLSKG